MKDTQVLSLDEYADIATHLKAVLPLIKKIDAFYSKHEVEQINAHTLKRESRQARKKLTELTAHLDKLYLEEHNSYTTILFYGEANPKQVVALIKDGVHPYKIPEELEATRIPYPHEPRLV